MRHRLALRFDNAEVMDRLQEGTLFTVHIPGESFGEPGKPLFETMHYDGSHLTIHFQMYYNWPMPSYTTLDEGVTVIIDQYTQASDPLGEAVVVDRWEERATRADWRNTPPVTPPVALDYQRDLTEKEEYWLTLGEIPREMEDKWFIFFEDGRLYYHRSWTGAAVYAVDISENAITGAWMYPHPEMPDASLEHLRGMIEYRCEQARSVLGEG